MEFKDHFSDRPERYLRYRPEYPHELFRRLAELAPARGLAWDCATGNGQAATGLAPFFELVAATDASPAQLARRRFHPRVRYWAAIAERPGLAEGSCDLVAVAQALHWLERDPFYAEARRVARPGAVIAAWTYGLLSLGPPVDDVIERFFSWTVGPCWPPERRWVDEGYATIPFPFERLPAPTLAIEAEWGLDDLLGYLGTWSAVRAYRERHGRDAVAEVAPELRRVWGGDDRRRVRWPLHLLVGRLDG